MNTTAESNTIQAEVKCESCNGTGHDVGGLNPFYPTECAVCGGSGVELIERVIEIGDVIEYRDDETDEAILATVIDLGAAPGWLEVTHDGRPEDDAGIYVDLVIRLVSWREYLDGCRKPAAIKTTDNERMVA